jgi:Protein of unknown function (DUF3306)
MSDQEKFLARWSRRKLEPADKQAPEESPTAADVPPIESAPSAPKAEVPEFDISTLPSLDSIGADSDIGAFLQAGVPSALRHAALRRAWSADPAIRDYIGPNENFWEGVGPGGVPGFGELDPNLDVKKLVAEVFGEAEREPRGTTEPASPTEQSTRAEVSASAAPVASESAQGEPQPSAAQDATPLLQRDENVALHHNDRQQEAAAARPRRHGGAMPE